MTAPTTLSLPTIRNHDPRARSPQRYVGPLLAAVGFGIVMVTAIANWVSIDSVGSDPAAVAETTLWAGGFGVLGLGVIKVAVAVVLVGIVLRLWIRVDVMKQSLPAIRVRDGAAPVHSTDKRVEVSPDAPQPLLIHRVTTRLWKPMLAMGAMTVILGAILRAVGAGQAGARRASVSWRRGASGSCSLFLAC